MPTKITMGFDVASKDGPKEIWVQENFDEVLEKFWPLNVATSNLEARSNSIFTRLDDGERIMIKVPSIALIEEHSVSD